TLPMTNAGLPYYMCPFCCVTFTEKEVYQAHISIHSQPQVFVSTFDLNKHYGVHCGFLYDCKECGRCFHSKNAPSQHQRTHQTLSIEETARSSDGKSSERTSASSFRGNSYITSLLSEYS
uniref:C2H2-type domain-containing protein n=1 Tax=Parascaris univalens TaxID=6257 RepID=A0A914ZQ17_PARUN